MSMLNCVLNSVSIDRLPLIQAVVYGHRVPSLVTFFQKLTGICVGCRPLSLLPTDQSDTGSGPKPILVPKWFFFSWAPPAGGWRSRWLRRRAVSMPLPPRRRDAGSCLDPPQREGRTPAAVVTAPPPSSNGFEGVADMKAKRVERGLERNRGKNCKKGAPSVFLSDRHHPGPEPRTFRQRANAQKQRMMPPPPPCRHISYTKKRYRK